MLIMLPLCAGGLTAMMLWLVPAGERWLPISIVTVASGFILIHVCDMLRVGGKVCLTIDFAQSTVRYETPSPRNFGKSFSLKFGEISRVELRHYDSDTSLHLWSGDHAFEIAANTDLDRKILAGNLGDALGLPVLDV